LAGSGLERIKYASAVKSAMHEEIILLVSRLLPAWILVHEGVFLIQNFDAAASGIARLGVPGVRAHCHDRLIAAGGHRDCGRLARAIGGRQAWVRFAWRLRRSFTAILSSETMFSLAQIACHDLV
jgi:hypothetical protein